MEILSNEDLQCWGNDELIQKILDMQNALDITNINEFLLDNFDRDELKKICRGLCEVTESDCFEEDEYE